METIDIVLLLIAGVLIVRLLLHSFIVGAMRKRIFERAYTQVLQNPKYQVKGKYE